MKITAITLLILVILMAFSLGVDLLMGFELRSSIQHALSPLIVMESAELIIFLSLIVIAIGKTFYFEYRKKK